MELFILLVKLNFDFIKLIKPKIRLTVIECLHYWQIRSIYVLLQIKISSVNIFLINLQ